jgi:myo-inositol-1(or 4)-monophosphatase
MKMVQLAIEAARAGGVVLRETLGAHRDIRWKTDEAGEQSVVTDVDLRADAAIQAVIRATAPTHMIFSEESQPGAPIGPHLWVLDPLDGTDEFSRGAPSCCVAVAYAYAGQTRAAAVYDPFRDELFAAAQGAGATLNGQPLHVSSVTQLDQAVIAFSSPDRRRSEAAFSETLTVLAAAIDQTRQVRLYGSTALEICWTAAGRLEGKLSLRGRVWDFLASALIVEEAGGACRDLNGQPIWLSTIGAVASNGHLQQPLTRLVREAVARHSAAGG